MKDEYIRKQDAIDMCGGYVCLAHCMSKINPADVVPVVHSEWIYHMSFGICKNCGYEYEWKGADVKNYCPSCGAKMDAEIMQGGAE